MLKCPICGFESDSLINHAKKHGLSNSDFKTIFGLRFLVSDRIRKIHSNTVIRYNPTKNGHSEKSRNKIKKNRLGKGVGVCGKYIRTKEIKEKISRSVSQAHLDGRLNTGGKLGCWKYSNKNNETMWLASSYEARLFDALEKHPSVLSFEREPFRIKYEFDGVIRNYIPDFLVTSGGGVQCLIEYKSVFAMAERKQCAKIVALHAYAETNGMNSFLMTEKELCEFERCVEKKVAQNV